MSYLESVVSCASIMHTLHVTHDTSVRQDQVRTGCTEVKACVGSGGHFQSRVTFGSISPATGLYTVTCEFSVIRSA
jgi:hypothetical protein